MPRQTHITYLDGPMAGRTMPCETAYPEDAKYSFIRMEPENGPPCGITYYAQTVWVAKTGKRLKVLVMTPEGAQAWYRWLSQGLFECPDAWLTFEEIVRCHGARQEANAP